MSLHWLLYNVGAVAGLIAGCLCVILLVWTLRNVRRSALRYEINSIGK